MTTYFFHIDGEGADAVGAECETLADARHVAIVRAGEITCDEPKTFAAAEEWRMTVSTDRGRPVFSIAISDNQTSEEFSDDGHISSRIGIDG